MAEPYWKQSLDFRKRYRLQDAAANGELVTALCMLCFRSRTYLASDLVAIIDPDGDAQAPPFACGHCGTGEHMKVTLRMPEPGDYGAVEVRRPAGVRRTQLWKTVLLGD